VPDQSSLETLALAL